MNDTSDKYANFSHDELVAEINRLKKHKKYGLVWEHKTEKVIEDFETQQPYLEEVTDKRIEDAPGEPTNLIIEGDNFEALSILNYTHAGKVDVIYIDPPYNTGNKDFIYNDNYVDSEDEFRHSKWLSFMKPRLKLAKNLLKDDGVIFISINDVEQPGLRFVCDEIFGVENFISTLIWKCRNSLYYTEPTISIQTEYILAYSKDITSFWLKAFDKDNLDGEKTMEGFYFNRVKKKYDGEGYSNPDNDPNGPFVTSGKVRNDGRPKYTVVSPTGVEHTEAWVYTPEVFKKLDELGQIYWGKDGSAQPRKKSYLKDFIGNVSSNYLADEIAKTITASGEIKKEKYFEIGTTESGTKELNGILENGVFPYPKPSTLIKYLFYLYPRKDAVFLDFFAGSGTSGHALLNLNKEDGGHRQFILCTNNGDKGPDSTKIAEEITYPRVKTVITGKRQDGSKYSDGVPANLRYYKINHREKKPSIDANRQDIVTYMENIIQVKENAYKQLEVNEDFAIYESSEKYVGLVFEPFSLEEVIANLKERNEEKRPVKLYVFSYSRDAFEDDYGADFEIEFVAMPEGLLKTYAHIVEEQKKEDL